MGKRDDTAWESTSRQDAAEKRDLLPIMETFSFSYHQGCPISPDPALVDRLPREQGHALFPHSALGITPSTLLHDKHNAPAM